MLNNSSRIIPLTCEGGDIQDSNPDLFAPNPKMVDKQLTFLLFILFCFSSIFFLANSESVLCPTSDKVLQTLNSHKSCLSIY